MQDLPDYIHGWEGILKARYNERAVNSLEAMIVEITFRGNHSCHLEIQWDMDPYASIQVKVHCGVGNRAMIRFHENSIDTTKAMKIIYDLVNGMLP